MKRSEHVPHVPGHRQASAAISAALARIRFPATRDDIITKIGAGPVDVDDVEIPLSEIARHLPHETFADFVEAQNEIDHHWADIRKLVLPTPEERA